MTFEGVEYLYGNLRGWVPHTPAHNPYEEGSMSRYGNAYRTAVQKFGESSTPKTLTPIEVREKRTAIRIEKYEAMKLSQAKLVETSVYKRDRGYRLELKESVLTFYGPKKKLGCCWEGCSVVDLDMLTLDHIKDDGAVHILPGQSHRLSSTSLYAWARGNKYPEGFQTLCANHQIKKQILKLRSEQEL